MVNLLSLSLSEREGEERLSKYLIQYFPLIGLSIERGGAGGSRVTATEEQLTAVERLKVLKNTKTTFHSNISFPSLGSRTSYG